MASVELTASAPVERVAGFDSPLHSRSSARLMRIGGRLVEHSAADLERARSGDVGRVDWLLVTAIVLAAVTLLVIVA
jgi:hypothetical protein